MEALLRGVQALRNVEIGRSRSYLVERRLKGPFTDRGSNRKSALNEGAFYISLEKKEMRT
jgi:hypothetical protein